jgi:hypothetical protein
LGSSRKILLLLLAAALSASLLLSCGDDNGAGPRCVNCDFWQKAFGRIGRFPSVSPVDPHLVAFASPDTFDCSATGYNHIWIALLPEIEGEDTQFFQITCDYYHDFKPVWSPDGNTIAFERRFGAGLSDIYTVDVTSIEAPGAPVQFTNRATLPQANYTPAWLTIGGQTWLAFANSSSGGNDYDLAMYRYPDRDQIVWLSIDPADYAKDENNVLSYIFKDQQVGSNGMNRIAFSSPDRVSVGDIKVVARSEESYPDSTAAAAIYINGKDSGKTTPYTFKYRPATDLEVVVKGELAGYCTDPAESLLLQPAVVNTVLLDFHYEHGTVGFASDPGVKQVFLDGAKLEGVRTNGLPTQYVYVPCIPKGMHTAYAANIVGEQRCSPIYEFEVLAGQTIQVLFDCTTAVNSAPGSRSPVVGTSQVQTILDFAGPNTLWVDDLNDLASTSDDVTYQVAGSQSAINEPAVSPDGKYVLFIRGANRSRQIVVVDVDRILAGEPNAIVIGLPGSNDELECWRIPEEASWVPTESGRKIIASLSVCGSASVPEDFEVWIADISRFIE